MQDFVTLKRRKNKSQTLIFSVIIAIIIIFFILVILISIYSRNKYSKEFVETSFYFVYVEKSKNLKELENMQDNLKELGGAGKIYQKENVYYLLSNVYDNQESAKSVVENNKAVYPNADVLEIKTKKVKNSIIRKYRENEINFKFVKNLNQTIKNICDFQMKYLSGLISENDLCSSLLTIKFDLDDVIKSVNQAEENEYKELILNYSNLEQMYFSMFFNSFFESSKKSSVLCEFVVGIVILKIDFSNNL